MNPRLPFALCFAIATLTSAAQVVAQEDSASLFSRANAAIERKEYREAAELFEQAHRQAPHPATVFNAAAAWEQARELPRAADAYESALSLGGLGVEQSSYAQDRLTVLKKSLGYLKITAPIGATASVAHAVKVPIPASVHLAPGAYTVVFHLGTSTEVRKPLRLLAGETLSVAGERPPPMAKADQPPLTPSAPPKRSEPPRDADSTDSRSTWGWVSVGSAGVLATAAVVLGIQTFGAIDDFEASGRKDLEQRDKAVKFRTWSNVAGAGAVVLGAAGIYLLLSSDGGTQSSAGKRARQAQPTSGQLEQLRF